MPFSRYKDTFLLILAVAALLGESLYLFDQMRIISLGLFRMAPTVDGGFGSIIEKSNVLRKRGPTSLSWFPLTVGDGVNYQDTLLTGEDSTALLRLKSGEEIFLEPNSLIQFHPPRERGEAQLSVELSYGAVKVKTAKKKFKLKTKTQAIQLTPETEVSLAQTPMASGGTIKVNQGTVQLRNLASQGNAQELEAGDLFRLSEKEPPTKIQTSLQVAAVSPTNKQVIFLEKEGLTMDLIWSGDTSPSIEWDYQPDFRSPKVVEAVNFKARVAWKSGRYFWRVKRGLAAGPAFETILVPPAKYRLLQPKTGASFKGKAEARFKWTPISGADLYELELSEKADFSSLVKNFKTTKPLAVWPISKVGRFYWRVRARHKEFGYWPYSAHAHFAVKKKVAAPKPKGMREITRKKKTEIPNRLWWRAVLDSLIPEARADEVPKLWFQFDWEASEGASAYILEIAEDKNFGKILHQERVATAGSTVELPERTQYYWRIASIDEDGELSEFSSIQVMERARAVDPKKNEAIVKRSAPVVSPKVSKPTRYTLDRVEFGYGGGFYHHNASRAGWDLTSQGFPANRFSARSYFHLGWSFQVSGFFQSMFHRNTVTSLSDFQSGYRTPFWGLEMLTSPGPLGGFPFWFGFQVRSELTAVSIAAESTRLEPAYYASPLVGTRVQWLAAKWARLSMLAALEGTPVGSRKGVGLVLRQEFRLMSLRAPYSLGGEIATWAGYRRDSLGSHTLIEVSALVWLGLQFESPEGNRRIN